MAKTHTATEDHVLNIITEWNITLATKGFNHQFQIECNRRLKKFAINSKDFFHAEIAELLLIKEVTTETGNIEDMFKTHRQIIFRIEQKIPNGDLVDKGDKIRWKQRLYSALLYEMFGNFANMILNLVNTQQLAEYDLATDTPRGNHKWHGRQVKIVKANELDWFKEGEEYDVFNHTDKGFIVHTWGKEGMKHNGFALISGVNAIPSVPFLITS